MAQCIACRQDGKSGQSLEMTVARRTGYQFTRVRDETLFICEDCVDRYRRNRQRNLIIGSVALSALAVGFVYLGIIFHWFWWGVALVVETAAWAPLLMWAQDRKDTSEDWILRAALVARRKNNPGETGVRLINREDFERIQPVPGRCINCLEPDKPGAEVTLVVAQEKGGEYRKIDDDRLFICDDCVAEARGAGSAARPDGAADDQVRLFLAKAMRQLTVLYLPGGYEFLTPEEYRAKQTAG